VDTGLDDLAMHRVIVAMVLALAAASAAQAHHTSASAGVAQFDIWLACLLLIGAALYARGIWRLWRKAGVGRGVRQLELLCFALGWASLAIALLSSIDTLAEHSFAVHMVQHEMLMVVAAPLIVLGRPLEAFVWGAPPAMRSAAAALARSVAVQALWPPVTSPLVAWSLHALALWIWHVPILFVLALTNFGWHVVQHICFFASALGFWWSVFAQGSRTARAWSIASLFTTMLHTSALGALLTFAPSAWYPLNGSPAFGLTALEDQQLGGLVMWVPGGLAYMIAGLAVVRRWLSAPCIAASATRRNSIARPIDTSTSPITSPAQNP
jgi:putative membrane protein